MEYKVTEHIKEFMFGGNSYFTIKNEVSGNFKKYHIKKKGTTYFVSVKEGANYVYAGYIRYINGRYCYSIGKAGSYEVDSSEIKALTWVVNHSNNMDNRISLIHHGKCACCGRSLDDEESIKRGFGPVCTQRMLATCLN